MTQYGFLSRFEHLELQCILRFLGSALKLLSQAVQKFTVNNQWRNWTFEPGWENLDQECFARNVWARREHSPRHILRNCCDSSRLSSIHAASPKHWTLRF